MPHITIDGVKHKIFLAQTEDGVDICIESCSAKPYVCRITNDGNLLLYANIDNNLNRTKNYPNCIRIEQEMDCGTD